MYWLLDGATEDRVRRQIVDLQLQLSRTQVRDQNEQQFPFNGRKDRKIARIIIEHLAPEQGLVCDPFAGSGTFAYAALDSGRQVKMNEWEPFAFRMSTAPFRPVPDSAALQSGIQAFRQAVEPVMQQIYQTKCPNCGRTLMFDSLFYDRVPEEYYHPMRHDRMGPNGENVVFRLHKCRCGCKEKLFDDFDMQVKTIVDAMPAAFPDTPILENSRINFTRPDYTHYQSLFSHRQQVALLTIQNAISSRPDTVRDFFDDTLLSILHLAKYVDYHSKSQDNHCPNNRLREHNLYYLFLNKLNSRYRYITSQHFDVGRVQCSCSDYRDFLDSLPPSSVDLMLTDPPYGDNAQHFEHAQRVHPFMSYCLEHDTQRLTKEVVISDSPQRPDKHGKSQFLNDLEELFSRSAAAVREHGYLVLYFRPEQQDWISDLNRLKHMGRKNGFEPLLVIPIDQRDPSMRALASAAWTFKKDICFVFLKLAPSECRWYESDTDVDELVYLSAMEASNNRGDPFVLERFLSFFRTRLTANRLLRLLSPVYMTHIQNTLERFCSHDGAQYTLLRYSPYQTFNRDMDAQTRLREFVPVVVETLTDGDRSFTLEEYIILLSSYLENGTKQIIAELHRANRLVTDLLVDYAEADPQSGLFHARAADATLPEPADGRISLRQMAPDAFERLIGDYFRRRGYINCNVIGRSCDRGVDILATNADGELELIQCKRYRQGNNVGSTAIQRVDSYARTRHGRKAWVITTSDFTAEGYDEARITNVITMNGEQLIRSLEQYYPGVYTL